MSALIAFDTATPATVVGLRLATGEVLSRRDDPEPGTRPNHAARLLALCADVLSEAGLRWADVARIGVGVGPGTFTGLRIGVATARAVAQATGAELVALSTLEVLAVGAFAPDRRVLAVLDARRGEAFASTWNARGSQIASPAALAPELLGPLAAPGGTPWLAVGDGAIRFRAQLESAHVNVPGDDSQLHLIGAPALCELAARGLPVEREQLVPDYVRRPDAEISRTPN